MRQEPTQQQILNTKLWELLESIHFYDFAMFLWDRMAKELIDGKPISQETAESLERYFLNIPAVQSISQQYPKILEQFVANRRTPNELDGYSYQWHADIINTVGKLAFVANQNTRLSSDEPLNQDFILLGGKLIRLSAIELVDKPYVNREDGRLSCNIRVASKKIELTGYDVVKLFSFLKAQGINPNI